MRTELIIFSEASHLLLHDPKKHIRRVAGLYMFSFFAGREIGNLARSGYYLARHIDDVLDGDRRFKGDPKDYVEHLRDEIQSGMFSGSTISQLAKSTILKLEERALPEDDVRSDWVSLINCMIFDYDRSPKKTVLSEQELKEYYSDTFMPTINILLIGLRSRLRAKDMTQFAECMGRVYSILDFQDDWSRGIINIPSEVLKPSGINTNNTAQEVMDNSYVKQWVQDEFIKNKVDLLALRSDIRNAAEPLTFGACNERITHMLKVIEKNTT